MKLFIPLLCVLFFNSCKEISGNFSAYEDITLKRKGKSISIPAGTYIASIKNHKNKKLKLKLTGINKNKAFSFKIPKNADLPRDNGSFSFSAEQVKQPYDVQGTVSTQRTLSEVREGTESCTYMERFATCNSNASGSISCRMEQRSRNGYRFARYQLQTTVKKLFIEMLSPAAILINSAFNAEETSHQKIYSYTEKCE